MIINKELFDECYCPCEGIARVELNGAKGIPTELEKMAREIDGDYYLESCFHIDINFNFNEDGDCAIGGMIYYVSETDYCELLVCDNAQEVWKYYRSHASKEDLEETLNF